MDIKGGMQMKPLAFSDRGRQQMIDHLLDTYNQYMELYHILQDLHFKKEADRTLNLIRKICQHSIS